MSRKKTQISDLNLKTIGGRIAYIRVLNDQNQGQFAEITGISKSNISGLENNKYEPSYQAIVKILEIYKIDPNWLLFGKGDIHKKSDSVQLDSDIPTENDLPHGEIRKYLQQKELARQISLDLIELEKIDQEELREIHEIIKLKLRRKGGNPNSEPAPQKMKEKKLKNGTG